MLSQTRQPRKRPAFRLSDESGLTSSGFTIPFGEWTPQPSVKFSRVSTVQECLFAFHHGLEFPSPTSVQTQGLGYNLPPSPRAHSSSSSVPTPNINWIKASKIISALNKPRFNMYLPYDIPGVGSFDHRPTLEQFFSKEKAFSTDTSAPAAESSRAEKSSRKTRSIFAAARKVKGNKEPNDIIPAEKSVETFGSSIPGPDKVSLTPVGKRGPGRPPRNIKFAATSQGTHPSPAPQANRKRKIDLVEDPGKTEVPRVLRTTRLMGSSEHSRNPTTTHQIPPVSRSAAPHSSILVRNESFAVLSRPSSSIQDSRPVGDDLTNYGPDHPAAMTAEEGASLRSPPKRSPRRSKRLASTSPPHPVPESNIPHNISSLKGVAPSRTVERTDHPSPNHRSPSSPHFLKSTSEDVKAVPKNSSPESIPASNVHNDKAAGTPSSTLPSTTRRVSSRTRTPITPRAALLAGRTLGASEPGVSRATPKSRIHSGSSLRTDSNNSVHSLYLPEANSSQSTAEDEEPIDVEGILASSASSAPTRTSGRKRKIRASPRGDDDGAQAQHKGGNKRARKA